MFILIFKLLKMPKTLLRMLKTLLRMLITEKRG